MWDSQYKHYQAIIDYINDHRDIYHTDIRFGTLSDYFDEVNARMKVIVVHICNIISFCLRDFTCFRLKNLSDIAPFLFYRRMSYQP